MLIFSVPGEGLALIQRAAADDVAAFDALTFAAAAERPGDEDAAEDAAP